MILLDGTGLAAARAPHIGRRAAQVTARRGRAPTLLLVAFADGEGRVPHVRSKLAASHAAGIEAVPLVIPADSSTIFTVDAMLGACEASRPDAVFVQIPAPQHMDEAAIAATIPAMLDVDVMSPERIRRFRQDPAEPAPLTVSAALLLLQAHDVSLAGRSGIIVADDSPFTRIFVEALGRAGARMRMVGPADAGLPTLVRRADLVVAAAGQPGLLPCDMIAAGAVALDIGYFNPGGRGDIDVGPGVAHLCALMPVPGGVGPMTVSALLERVVEFAEATRGMD